MKKQGLFLSEWSFGRIKVLELPYNVFYVVEGNLHSVFVPHRIDTVPRIRKALDNGYSPFTLDWFSKNHGGIGANELEYLEIGKILMV